MLLFFGIANVFKSFFEFSYENYIITSALLVTILCLNFFVKKPEFEKLLIIPLRNFQRRNDNMVDLWIELKLLAESHNVEKINLFLEKMKNQITDAITQEKMKRLNSANK